MSAKTKRWAKMQKVKQKTKEGNWKARVWFLELKPLSFLSCPKHWDKSLIYILVCIMSSWSVYLPQLSMENKTIQQLLFRRSEENRYFYFFIRKLWPYWLWVDEMNCSYPIIPTDRILILLCWRIKYVYK